MAGPIKISVLADAGQASQSMRDFATTVQRSMTSASGSASEGVTSLKTSTGEIRRSMDDAAEGFDRTDTAAMGFRDGVTGIQDAMSLAKGDFDNFGEALLLGGFAIGDMASSMVNFMIPALKGGIGWIKNLTIVQRIMNITMLSNPVFLVVAAVAALTAVLVVAYRRSETFRRVVDAVWATMRGAWGRIPGFVSSIVQRIAGFFSGVKGKILGFFSGAGGWLKKAARDIINGFVDGLRAGFRRVEDTLGSLTGMIPDWKGPAERDRDLLSESGRLVIEGFRRGLEEQYSGVERSLSRWTGGLGTDLTADVTGTATGSGRTTGAQPVILTLAPGRSGDRLVDALWDELRHRISVRGRGNVQIALGR